MRNRKLLNSYYVKTRSGQMITSSAADPANSENSDIKNLHRSRFLNFEEWSRRDTVKVAQHLCAGYRPIITVPSRQGRSKGFFTKIYKFSRRLLSVPKYQ